MTWMIAIDESGDLGHGSRYFTMAAIVTMRSRNLKSASKLIPKCKYEYKFYNSTPFDRKRILNELCNCSMQIYYLVVDKHDHSGKYYGIYKNDLFKLVLQDLLELIMSNVSPHDVNVLIDDCSHINLSELTTISKKVALMCSWNVLRCEKIVSKHNTCIQLVDYVAGAIQRNYEKSNSEYFDLIKKVSIARTT